MARKKKSRPKPQPVSTTAILREIKRALAKIKLKRKKAGLEQAEALELEMNVLERCQQHIFDIFLG